MPHVPLFRSKAFANKSLRGLYGDVIEEIDWSVGQVLEAIRQSPAADNTLVFFTSDNGPWLIFNEQGGSAGLLRDGKGSTWEGGMREPTLAWWPGTIAAGSVSRQLASSMDIFTTASKLAQVEIPEDRILDSFDLMPALQGETGQRKTIFYYRGYRLMAVRHGNWKMHLLTQDAYGQPQPVSHDTPLLFNLHLDPSEKRDVSKENPDVIKLLSEVIQEHLKSAKHAESQLEK